MKRRKKEASKPESSKLQTSFWIIKGEKLRKAKSFISFQWFWFNYSQLRNGQSQQTQDKLLIKGKSKRISLMRLAFTKAQAVIGPLGRALCTKSYFFVSLFFQCCCVYQVEILVEELMKHVSHESVHWCWFDFVKGFLPSSLQLTKKRRVRTFFLTSINKTRRKFLFDFDVDFFERN